MKKWLMRVAHIEDAYLEALTDYEAHQTSRIKYGRMQALAAVLTAARNGGPIVLITTGKDEP